LISLLSLSAARRHCHRMAARRARSSSLRCCVSALSVCRRENPSFTYVGYLQTLNIEGYEKNYRELAKRKVDVFLAVGNEPALRAALSAAEGKPIAFLAVDFDPLAKGYVTNLSRPGGNLTGIFVRQLELAAKRVEIAREAFPRATVVGIAFDTVSRGQRDASADAARKLGLEPRMIELKGEQAYRDAFGEMDNFHHAARRPGGDMAADGMRAAGAKEIPRVAWGAPIPLATPPNWRPCAWGLRDY
jgi:hypothetical protein